MAYDIGTSHQMTRDEIGSESSTDNVFKRFSHQAKLVNGPTIIEEITLGGDFIIGHDTYGILGASGYPIGDSGNDTTVTSEIFNLNNVYEDRFYTDAFTSSKTGTISNGTLSLGSGQYYYSNSIAYNAGKQIQTAKVTLTSNDDTISGVTLQLSNDGGSNYFGVTQGVTYSFTTTGTNLKIKITNGGGSTANINKLSVEYTTN